MKVCFRDSEIRDRLTSTLRSILQKAHLSKWGEILRIEVATEEEKYLVVEQYQVILDELAKSRILSDEIITSLRIKSSQGEAVTRSLKRIWGTKMNLLANDQNVEIYDYQKALTEIQRHEHETRLPASFVRMRDDMPLLVSQNIEISSGLTFNETMQKFPINNQKYFPPDQYQLFRDAIVGAEGKETEVIYKARDIKDLEMKERTVRGRLVLFGGEYWRVVKTIALPRSVV